MQDCLFCKFVNGELKTEIVFENEDFIMIRDINPQAKNHFLAIPKKHYKFLAEASEEDLKTLGRILGEIPRHAELLGLKSGYRLVINQGDDAGQTVPHLHIHVLSGGPMGWNPA